MVAFGFPTKWTTLDVPEHIVVVPVIVADGKGLTFIVAIIAFPVQPSADGIIV